MHEHRVTTTSEKNIDSQNGFICLFIQANIYCVSPLYQAPPLAVDTMSSRHEVLKSLCYYGTRTLKGDKRQIKTSVKCTR